MFMDVDAPIIKNYSPISSKGGRRCTKRYTRRHSKRMKHNRSNKSRTRNNRSSRTRRHR